MNHKYPKFKLLVFSVFIVSILVNLLSNFEFTSYFENTGYLGLFISGLMYSYSFLGPFAVGVMMFIIGPESNINLILGALLAGIGAATSDLIILRFIKDNLTDEIVNLLHEKYIAVLRSKIHNKVKSILNPLIGFIILGSPLPDEIGLIFLSNANNIAKPLLFLLCLSVNSIGIYIVLRLAQLS